MEDFTFIKDESVGNTVAIKEEAIPEFSFVAVNEDPYLIGEQFFDDHVAHPREFSIVPYGAEESGLNTESFNKFVPSSVNTVIKEELIVEDSEDEELSKESSVLLNVCLPIESKITENYAVSALDTDSNKKIWAIQNGVYCEVCNKTFAERKNLLRHKLIHSGIRKYQCDLCNKSYYRKELLTRHKLIHSDIKKYQCEVCKKAFSLLDYLRRHKAVHTRVKNYKCNVCNKAFTRSEQFSAHKLMHSVRFQCHICGVTLSNSCDLSRHITNVHKK